MSSPPATHEPLRLNHADFDAYLPERATSNAFTRARLELKQRLLAWASGVVARLAELDVAVEVSASDERPSLRNGRRVDAQRVFFWRDAAARAEIDRRVDRARSLTAALGDPAPHQKHAFLELRIDARQVEVSVELHPDAWIDARNLRARLSDPEGTLELTSALEALPEQFQIGLSAGDPSDASQRGDAQRASSDVIRALLDRGEAEGRALWIGWCVPRDVAVEHSAVLDEQLEDAIVALGPIYKLVAWAPDNDRVVLGREAEAAEGDRVRARDREEASRDPVSWGRRPREGRAAPPRRITRPTDARDEAPIDGDAPVSEPARVPAPAKAPVLRTLARRAPPRVTEVDPSAPIEKGTRVQVLAGAFMGKVGVVQELDGKGGARVMLGLLATRVDVKDLIACAEGKDRPALASSHRKPIPARS